MLRFSMQYSECIYDQIPNAYAAHLSPEVVVKKAEKKCVHKLMKTEKAIINEFPSSSRKKTRESAVKAKEIVRTQGIELVKKFRREFPRETKKALWQ